MSLTSWREQHVAIRETPPERSDDFAADFVTARARRGPYGHAQVFGKHAMFISQTIKCLHHDRSEGAAPARMNGSKCSGARIADQQRNAIGSLNRQKNVWAGAHQSIATIIVTAGIRRRLSVTRVHHHSHRR